MATHGKREWGQDRPLLRLCDLGIFKLMNFEATVLHENGIRPRLRKSPLNLKQHLRTPTWPVALRLSNVRCFSELRMQVAYMESSYSCQPAHCCVEQGRKFGPDKHRLVACGCSGSTVAVSPPVQPSFLHLPPQPLNPNMEIASCFKT